MVSQPFIQAASRGIILCCKGKNFCYILRHIFWQIFVSKGLKNCAIISWMVVACKSAFVKIAKLVILTGKLNYRRQ
jgi:hypothetical protein